MNTLSAEELRSLLNRALSYDKLAERALLEYFCNAWNSEIEPDRDLLRAYCLHVFEEELRRKSSLLFVRRPPHRPPASVADGTIRDLYITAIYRLLREKDVTAEETIARINKIFHLGAKSIEAIVNARRNSFFVASFPPSEVEDLLQRLESQAPPKSST